MSILNFDEFVNEGLINRTFGKGHKVDELVDYIKSVLYKIYRKFEFNQDAEYKNDRVYGNLDSDCVKYDHHQKIIYLDESLESDSKFISFCKCKRFGKEFKKYNEDHIILKDVPNGGFTDKELDKFKKTFLTETVPGVAYMIANYFMFNKRDKFAYDCMMGDFQKEHPYLLYYGYFGYKNCERNNPSYYYIKLYDEKVTGKDYKFVQRYSLLNSAADMIPDGYNAKRGFYFVSDKMAKKCKDELNLTNKIEKKEKGW